MLSKPQSRFPRSAGKYLQFAGIAAATGRACPARHWPAQAFRPATAGATGAVANGAIGP
jgi:hypothetical protein